jgi:excisionase family DNA binding protein
MAPPAEPPAVLTVPEAGRLLRIGRGAAYEAARRGELPVVRIGRTLRVPRHALMSLLNADELASNELVGKMPEDARPHEPY